MAPVRVPSHNTSLRSAPIRDARAYPPPPLACNPELSAQRVGHQHCRDSPMYVSQNLAARFILVLELAALTAAGCSSHAAKRYVYDLGNQHRCAEGTEHRPYGSAEWL